MTGFDPTHRQTEATVRFDWGTHPFRWRDGRAALYAQEVGADLARTRDDGLSPAAMARRSAGRLVLPSPNGATVATVLAEAGATVVAGCLRNATAMADWIARSGATSVAVVAAGERWPDETLRPAAEDLWGAGAVLLALQDRGITDLSPEAMLAADAYAAVRPRLGASLASCASGLELIARGYEADVRIAADADGSSAVPFLSEGRFVDAE